MTLILSGTNGLSDVNGSAAAPAITGTDTDTGVFFGTNTVSLSTGGTERLQVDSFGNLGLGVTPSAWVSSVRALDVGSGGGFVYAGDFTVAYNAYTNGANWIYKTTNGAARYTQGTSGQHVWYSAASGTAGNAITFTQAMTLDASGNLGVGSTSPNIGGLTRALTLNTPTAGNYSGVELAGAGTLSARFITNNVGTYFGSQLSIPLIFETNATERARIDTSGNLIVGSTNAQLQFNATTNNGNISVISSAANANLNIASKGAGGITLNATGGLYCSQVYSTAVGGTNRAVYTDNTGTIGYLSSVRASKTNIETLADVSWLMQLDSVQFNYRKRDVDGNYTEEFDSTIEYGLIAEEAEAVKQELCFYDEVDGSRVLRGVNYQKLVIPMLKAIQEQQTIIETLTNRIAALENK